MSAELAVPVVAASLAGSFHCALMCGGLVATLGGSSAEPKGARYGRQLSFHGGRLLIYGLLGAAAGAVGSAINLVGQHAGVVRAAGLLAGVLVVLVGLAGLLSIQGVRLPRWSGPISGQRWLIARLVSAGSGGFRQAALLGASTALLPCGWLYAFAISAAGTGSPWFGALVMAAFWLGTVPALFGVGVLAGRLLSPLKRHAPLLSAALLVTVGLSAIFQRSNIPVEAFNQVRGALAGDNTTAPKAPACH